MILYTAQYLRQILKKSNLPHSRQTFLNMEKAGIVPKPEHELVYRAVVNWGRNTIRIYTEEEIKKIVQIVADYIEKRIAYAQSQKDETS